MATANKIPLLGFASSVKGLVLLGFGRPATEDAYLDAWLAVSAQGRTLSVGEVSRFVWVPPDPRTVRTER